MIHCHKLFSLELVIPRSWMKAILGVGDKKFEQLLLGPSARDANKSQSDGNNAMNWKDSDMFVSRSRKELMDKILSYRGNEYQLHSLIAKYYKTFVETNEVDTADEDASETSKSIN